MHFFNCALLTFGPPYVIYKSYLADFDAYANVMRSGLAYVVAQLAKMILLATFSFSTGAEGSTDWVQELFKMAFSAVDAVALYYLLKSSYITGDKRVQVFSVGLGWAIADSVFMRAVPLYIGATSLEFSWTWLQMALEANVLLLTHVAFAAVMFMFRKCTRDAVDRALVALAVTRCATPFVLTVSQEALGVGAWAALVLQAMVALPYCAVVRSRFARQQGAK